MTNGQGDWTQHLEKQALDALEDARRKRARQYYYNASMIQDLQEAEQAAAQYTARGSPIPPELEEEIKVRREDVRTGEQNVQRYTSRMKNHQREFQALDTVDEFGFPTARVVPKQAVKTDQAGEEDDEVVDPVAMEEQPQPAAPPTPPAENPAIATMDPPPAPTLGDDDTTPDLSPAPQAPAPDDADPINGTG
jgi:hypothetical protein